MTRAGTDFEYTEDSVSARLAVDIPADTLASLAQVAAQTNELKVNMQSVAVSTNDFAEYLRLLPRLLQETAAAGEQFFNMNAQRGGAMSSSGRDMSRNDQADTTTLWNQDAPGTGAGRDDLEALRRDNPRQYGNMMAQRDAARGGSADPNDRSRVVHEGGGDPLPPPRPTRPEPAPSRPPRQSRNNPTGPDNRNDNTPNPADDGPDWIQRAQQYQQRGDGALRTILNETQQGSRENGFSSTASAINHARTGIGNFQSQMEARQAALHARATEEMLNGGDGASTLRQAQLAGQAGRLGGMALKGAGVAGVAVGGAMAVQEVGEWYQKHAAVGMERGGGAAEGLAFEAQVRTMAMNPFISTEQSRKIMQSALNQGYTGKEMDTVTEFMAENLKKMNVDVATSTKILQENVIKGGQSIESAQADAKTAQMLSQNEDAKKTGSQFVESWSSATSTAVAAGTQGEAASQGALQTTSFYSENQNLKNIGSQIMDAGANSFVFQDQMAREIGYKGDRRGALSAYLEQGKDPNAIFAKTVKEFANQDFLKKMLANGDTKEAGYRWFETQMKLRGFTLDRAQSSQLIKDAWEGKLDEEVTRASTEAEDAATGGDVKQMGNGGGISNWFKGVGNQVKAIGNAVTWGVGAVFDEDLQNGSYEAMTSNWRASGGRFSMDAGGDAGSYTNARIEDLVMDAGGSDKIKIRDKSGKERDFDMSDENLMNQVKNGEVQVKMDRKGDWTTLGEYGKDANTASQSNGSGVLDLTDEAKALVKMMNNNPHLTQTQLNSNSGAGGQRNDPKPGENPGGR